jgi:cytidylate kinase
VAPLVAAPGAIVVDSTGLTAEAVAARILALAGEQGLGA